ncbi:putative Ubiquitin carboxyl-terminal hydrolase 47 [Blattamonas nauphoetae]|uniref:Ubiquitin carboxyl-terminal hydrolase 47 n=1 Tax=Blattamonas nauphoetae TaxID=2049346 RepID=A0ABQ9Y6Z6_9EUKA|nr:putative Ubiquitin carboxyl-terminal hydrolase 47 [Blattamonas nauphoetae]
MTQIEATLNLNSHHAHLPEDSFSSDDTILDRSGSDSSPRILALNDDTEVVDFLSKPLKPLSPPTLEDDDQAGAEESILDLHASVQSDDSNVTPPRREIGKKPKRRKNGLEPTASDTMSDRSSGHALNLVETPIVSTPSTCTSTPTQAYHYSPSNMLSSPQFELSYLRPSLSTIDSGLNQPPPKTGMKPLVGTNHKERKGSGRVWKVMESEESFIPAQIPSFVSKRELLSPERTEGLRLSPKVSRSRSVDLEDSPSMNYMRTLDILSMSRSDLTKMKFGDCGEDGWSDGNENESGMGKGVDVSVSNEISGIGSHSTNDVLPTLGKDEEGWSGGGTGPKVFSERTVQFVVPAVSEEARMGNAEVGRLKPEFAVLPNVFSQSSPEMGQNALGTEISKSTSMSEPLLDVGMRTTRDSAEELPPAPSILTTPPTTMSSGPSADESSPRFAGKVPQEALPMTFGFPPSTPFLHWNKLEAEEVSDRVKRVRAMEGHASLPRDDPPGVSLSFLTDKDGDRDRDGDGVGMGRGRRIGRSGKEKGEKRGESEGQVVSFTKFEFEKEDEEAVNELMKMSGFRRERCRVALRASGNSIGLGREWLEKKKGVSLVDLVVSSQEECGRRIEVDVARSERRLKRQQRKEKRSRSSRRTRPAPIVPRVPLSELSRELESLLTELEEGTPQASGTARVQFSTNRRIVFELQRLFATLLSSQNEATTTTGLTESFGWTTRDAGSQQDILELNHLLLEALEVKLKGTGLSKLVDSTFGGWQSNRVKCSECGSESENAEAFRDLSVPLLSSSSDVVGERSTLEACLSSMMGGEELIGENQYFCSECSSKVDAHRYSVLSSVPPLLTLALMRFSYDWDRDARVKNSSFASFPFFLDLKEFIREKKENKDDDQSDPRPDQRVRTASQSDTQDDSPNSESPHSPPHPPTIRQPIHPDIISSYNTLRQHKLSHAKNDVSVNVTPMWSPTTQRQTDSSFNDSQTTPDTVVMGEVDENNIFESSNNPPSQSSSFNLLPPTILELKPSHNTTVTSPLAKPQSPPISQPPLLPSLPIELQNSTLSPDELAMIALALRDESDVSFPDDKPITPPPTDTPPSASPLITSKPTPHRPWKDNVQSGDAFDLDAFNAEWDASRNTGTSPPAITQATVEAAPLTLDIVPLPEVDFTSPHLFELCGVVIHSGGAYGGHYHVLIRDSLEEGPASSKQPLSDHPLSPSSPPNIEHLAEKAFGKWYDFNDTKVTQVSPLSIQKTFSGASDSAYILLYRKCGTNTGNDIIHKITSFSPQHLPTHLQKDFERKQAIAQVESALRSIRQNHKDFPLLTLAFCQLGKFKESETWINGDPPRTIVTTTLHLREDFSKTAQFRGEWEFDMRTSIETAALDLFKQLPKVTGETEEWKEVHIYAISQMYRHGGHFQVEDHFLSLRRVEGRRGRVSVEVLYPSKVVDKGKGQIDVTPHTPMSLLTVPSGRYSLFLLPSQIEDTPTVSSFDVPRVVSPPDLAIKIDKHVPLSEIGHEMPVTVHLEMKPETFTLRDDEILFHVIPIPLDPGITVAKAKLDPNRYINQLRKERFYHRIRTGPISQFANDSSFEVTCSLSTSVMSVKQAIQEVFGTTVVKHSDVSQHMFTHSIPSIFWTDVLGGCGKEIDEPAKSLKASGIHAYIRVICILTCLEHPIPIIAPSLIASIDERRSKNIRVEMWTIEICRFTDAFSDVIEKHMVQLLPTATVYELHLEAATLYGFDPHFSRLYNSESFELPGQMLVDETVTLRDAGLHHLDRVYIEAGAVPLPSQISITLSLLIPLVGSPLDLSTFAFTPIEIPSDEHNLPFTVLPGSVPALLQAGDLISSFRSPDKDELSSLLSPMESLKGCRGDLFRLSSTSCQSYIPVRAPLPNLRGFPPPKTVEMDVESYCTRMSVPGGIGMHTKTLSLSPPPPPFFLLNISPSFTTSTEHTLDQLIENALQETYPHLFSLILRKMRGARLKVPSESGSDNVRVFEMNGFKIKRLLGKKKQTMRMRKSQSDSTLPAIAEVNEAAIVSHLPDEISANLDTVQFYNNSLFSHPSSTGSSNSPSAQSPTSTSSSPYSLLPARLHKLSSFSVTNGSHLAFQILDSPIDIKLESKATSIVLFLFELRFNDSNKSFLGSWGSVVFDKKRNSTVGDLGAFLAEKVGVPNERLILAKYLQTQGVWNYIVTPSLQPSVANRLPLHLKDASFIMFADTNTIKSESGTASSFDLEMLRVGEVEDQSSVDTIIIPTLMGQSAMSILHPQATHLSVEESFVGVDEERDEQVEAQLAPKAKPTSRALAEPSLRINLN